MTFDSRTFTTDQASSRRIAFESVDCIHVLDADGRLVTIDPGCRAAFDGGDAPFVDGVDWRTFWHDEGRAFVGDALNVARGGGVGHFIGRHASGTDRWWDVSVAAIPSDDAPGRLIAILRDVTGLRTLAAQESRQRDLVDRRLRAIDAASTLLAESLDFEVTLASVAGIAVDAFATFCAIEVTDGFGRRHAVVRSGRRDADAAIGRLRACVARAPLTTVSASVVERAAPLVHNEIDGGWLAAVQTDAATTAALAELDVAAMLCVPIVHDGIATGSISLFVDRADHDGDVGTRFNSVDSAFAEQLGRRAGASLANARSYGRERAIAVRMQEEALPSVLPRIDHLHLSSAYRPSSSEATIAGDWYDAFPLPDGRIAMSVGDVGGHGLTAALTMTKLRQAMRAAALSVPNVTTMLGIAEQTLRMDGGHVYATALAAIYDPTNRGLELAGAGHPGPLMRHPDGRIEDLTSFAPLLGVGHVPDRWHSVTVPPGAAILFFTDGLVEFERDFDAGFARLRNVLATVPIGEPDLADRVLNEVVGASPTPDDVAILAAYVAPETPEQS